MSPPSTHVPNVSPPSRTSHRTPSVRPTLTHSSSHEDRPLQTPSLTSRALLSSANESTRRARLLGPPIRLTYEEARLQREKAEREEEEARLKREREELREQERLALGDLQEEEEEEGEQDKEEEGGGEGELEHRLREHVRLESPRPTSPPTRKHPQDQTDTPPIRPIVPDLPTLSTYRATHPHHSSPSDNKENQRSPSDLPTAYDTGRTHTRSLSHTHTYKPPTPPKLPFSNGGPAHPHPHLPNGQPSHPPPTTTSTRYFPDPHPAPPDPSKTGYPPDPYLYPAPSDPPHARTTSGSTQHGYYDTSVLIPLSGGTTTLMANHPIGVGPGQQQQQQQQQVGMGYSQGAQGGRAGEKRDRFIEVRSSLSFLSGS